MTFRQSNLRHKYQSTGFGGSVSHETEINGYTGIATGLINASEWARRSDASSKLSSSAYDSYKIELGLESLEAGGGGQMKNWTPIKEALATVPCAPGIFKIGMVHESWIEVVYIGTSTSERTLREVITCIMFGYEGGERLAMMVVNPSTRKKLMIQWIQSVFPEELIEDELEEYIATNHRIPEYNVPIDASKNSFSFRFQNYSSHEKKRDLILLRGRLLRPNYTEVHNDNFKQLEKEINGYV